MKLLKFFGFTPPMSLARTRQQLKEADCASLTARVYTHTKDTTFIHSALHDAGVRVITDAHEHSSALIVDASGLNTPSDFNTLYTAIHNGVGALQHNARILIVSDAPHHSAFHSSILPALEGFMRSLSKEVGRFGTTVNLIHADNTALPRMAGVLRFLLSTRSAFISAQTFCLSERVQDDACAVYTAPLAGKTMVVTGAGRGIGLAIATALAREGAMVIGVDVPNTPSLQAQMKQLGGLALELDITADDATKQLCAFLHSHTGAVNGIIHNAGITRDKTLKYMSESQWQSVLDVNLNAPIKLTQALLAQNLILNGGRIMGLSSISGIAGNAGQTHYALTKGGLAGYINGLANELASKGITANTIAPGFIETDMTARIPFMVRTIGRRFNALKQGGLPEDVAELAVFLASANSAGITGHNIRVCGHNLLGK